MSGGALEARLVSHHVGGRGGTRSFPDAGQFERDLVNVLYEADVDSIEQIRLANAERGSELLVLPSCLGARSGEQGTLRINYDPFTSSLRPFNPAYAGYYGSFSDHDYVFGEAFAPVEERRVTLDALDDLVRAGRAPAPDFLSLDTQGAEMEILQGAAGVLQSHVVAAVVEVEFQPLYSGQPLFGDLTAFLAERGFHFARFLNQHEVKPARAPIGLRGDGFHLYDDALYLRRVEDIAALPCAPEARWLMLQKLAFVALNFSQLEYALLCLSAARQIAAEPPLQGQNAPGYIRFLAGLDDRAAAMPPQYPRSFRQMHSFEQSVGRFRPEWRRRRADLSLVFSKADQAPSPVEGYLAGHGYGQLAHNVRHRRLMQQYISAYVAANPGFDQEYVMGNITWKYE